MSYSSLVTYINYSKNTYGRRTHKVDTLIPHVIVGQVTTKRGTDIFSGKGYKWSCNYCLGKEGGCGLVLDEDYASICTSNKGIDERAITFEIASDTFAPYKITNNALNTMINLIVDIMKRYGKNTLVWIPDKAKNKAYEPKANEMKLSCHRFYANKSCPGDYIFGLESAIAQRVNEILAGKKATPIPTPVTNTTNISTVPKQTTSIVKVENTFDYDNLKFNGVDMKPVFDPTFYYNNYPDLQKAVGYVVNTRLLFNHFCTKGVNEARQGISTFNAITYKANYADLANAYKNEWIKYYQHYLTIGIKEGRRGV